MGMILRIASSRIVGQGDIVGRSGYFSLNLSANSVMRGRLDARRTLKSLVADLRFKKKIVVYGSSILQGASASRPGMAYPARLSRSSGYNFINLGLSGNGKMEKEVAGMLANIDADAFILDCIPNPSPKEITERAVGFVMTLREKHPDTPIIIIQTLIRETGNFNQKARENVKQQNEAIAEQVEVLRKKGVKNLYFIKEDRFLGTDHEGTIDGTHPNDLGFDRMLKKYKPAISKILKIKFRDE